MTAMSKAIFAEPSLIGLNVVMIAFLMLVGVAVAAVVLVIFLVNRSRSKPATAASPPPPAPVAPAPATERKCPQCGSELKPGTPEGLCPACLLKQGIATEPAGPPGQTAFVPPTVAELTKLFPQLEILE